jgi:hypothetical protein
MRLAPVAFALAVVLGAPGHAQAATRSSFDDLVANLKSPNVKTRLDAAASLGKSRRRVCGSRWCARCASCAT